MAAEDQALASTSVSMEVTSTNGVPIVAERAMWWPGSSPATWHEAHVSAGSQETGVAWAFAEGEQGGPAARDTYVLVANTAAAAGSARVSVFFEDGTTESKTVALDAAVADDAAHGDAVSLDGRAALRDARRESRRSIPCRSSSSARCTGSANGVVWAAGTAALGAPLR